MVTIATPMFDGKAEAGYIHGIVGAFKVLEKAGIEYDYLTLSGDSFIDRARNRLVKQFLDSGSDDLIFIDADVQFSPEGVFKLLKHDVDIVGGVYPKKTDVKQWPCTIRPNVSKGNILGAEMIPAGFMRVRRRVFEALEVESYEVFGEQIPEYFTCGRRDGRFKGEDVNFCKLALDNGFDLWVEPDISFSHVGKKSYSGNFLQECCEITD
jgi:glycosyltransferase involved in cell wall biosynthesis